MTPTAAPRARRLTPLAPFAWVVVLGLTGAVQFYRGVVVDALVFCVLAAVLLADALGAFRGLRPARWAVPWWLVVVPLGVVAAVLALTPRHGLADGVALAASGVLVAVIAWPNASTNTNPNPNLEPREPDNPRAPWSPRLKRAALAWAIIAILICLWELTMFLLGGFAPGGRQAYPAISDLLDPLLERPVGRILFVAAWLIGGIALLRRGRTR